MNLTHHWTQGVFGSRSPLQLSQVVVIVMATKMMNGYAIVENWEVLRAKMQRQDPLKLKVSCYPTMEEAVL